MIFFQRIMKTLLFAQLMVLLIADYGNTTFIKCHYLPFIPHNCSEINNFNLPISVSKLTLWRANTLETTIKEFKELTMEFSIFNTKVKCLLSKTRQKCSVLIIQKNIPIKFKNKLIFKWIISKKQVVSYINKKKEKYQFLKSLASILYTYIA